MPSPGSSGTLISPLTTGNFCRAKCCRSSPCSTQYSKSFTTIELKVNFLRAVRQTTLTAEAKVVKAGSTLGYVECEVIDEQGRLVAKAASTCLKLNRG